MMKVLVACEYSGTVRDAFLAAGHDASKKTCLWLVGLPPLVPTQIIEPRLIDGKSVGQIRLIQARTGLGLAMIAGNYAAPHILALPRQWLSNGDNYALRRAYIFGSVWLIDCAGFSAYCRIKKVLQAVGSRIKMILTI